MQFHIPRCLKSEYIFRRKLFVYLYLQVIFFETLKNTYNAKTFHYISNVRKQLVDPLITSFFTDNTSFYQFCWVTLLYFLVNNLYTVFPYLKVTFKLLPIKS